MVVFSSACHRPVLAAGGNYVLVNSEYCRDSSVTCKGECIGVGRLAVAPLHEVVVFGSRGGEGNLLAVGVGACAADATLLGIASCRNGIVILHQTDGLPEVAIVAAPVGCIRVEVQVAGVEVGRAVGRSRPEVAAVPHKLETRPVAAT